MNFDLEEIKDAVVLFPTVALDFADNTLVRSLLSAAGGVALIVGSFFAIRALLKNYSPGDHFDDGPPKTALFIVLMAIPTLVGAALFNLTWLKIWIAPKIFLIEYAANLAK